MRHIQNSRFKIQNSFLVLVILSAIVLFSCGGGSSTPNPPAAEAPTAIAWNAFTTNADGTPALVYGYRVICLQNGAQVSFDAGNTTTVQLAALPISDGGACCGVVAYNSSSETSMSEEVCFTKQEGAFARR